MRILLCMTAACLLCMGARADQAQWISKEQAEAASNALFYYTPLRIFCEPCGDEHWRPLVVDDIEVRATGANDYHELVISGEAVDLAYTYFPHEGEYRNLAIHLGIPVQDVSEVLAPWTTGPLPEFSGIIFSGEIDDGPAVMLTIESKEGDLRGNILFTREAGFLSLEGTVDEYGEFTLSAVDDYGDGETQYDLTGAIAPEAMAIRGVIAEPDGGGERSFHAERIGRTVTQRGEITVGAITATTTLHYPMFVDGPYEFLDAVNAMIAREVQMGAVSFAQDFARGVADYSLIPDSTHFGDQNQSWETFDYAVTAYGEGIVSLALHSYYYSGGAHGMSFHTAMNLVPGEDGARALALSELFAEGADYWAALTAYCIEDLRAQEASWVLNGTVTDIGEETHATWTLSPGGLSFYYDPYEMGPYAEGNFKVWVPFDALTEYLDAAMLGSLFDGE